jgi:hypothetical protein
MCVFPSQGTEPVAVPRQPDSLSAGSFTATLRVPFVFAALVHLALPEMVTEVVLTHEACDETLTSGLLP